MTVKKLIQENPFVDIKVRDISKGYAYVQDIESVAQMEVESCCTSEATNGMRPVLYVNVRGDIDCQSWCDYPSEEEIQDDSVIAWKEIVPPKEVVE